MNNKWIFTIVTGLIVMLIGYFVFGIGKNSESLINNADTVIGTQINTTCGEGVENCIGLNIGN